MVYGFQLLIFFFGVTSQLEQNNLQIEQLVAKWAPLIWMSPEEKYMPSSVDNFLHNVYVADENGKFIQHTYSSKVSAISKPLFLVTPKPLDILKLENNSFLHGKNPKLNSVPVYAVVKDCTSPPIFNNHISFKSDDSTMYSQTDPNMFFQVSYWTFYPYNEGKEVCFYGKVPTPMLFNTCFGNIKTMGNHVGDWEHMSLFFTGKPSPSKMFLAVHDTGAYYKYDERRRIFKFDKQFIGKSVVQKPKFPRIVRTQTGHPVLFSAFGSHGLWAAPGEHYFVRMPKLTDINGYGVPWKTWKNVITYHLGKSNTPDWMAFKGKWGNPKSNCLLFRKLGLCEYSDGPSGILQKNQDFYCK